MLNINNNKIRTGYDENSFFKIIIKIKRMSRLKKVVLFYQQNMLHAVSYGEKRWYAVDKTTGSLLYIKKFSSRQPFAINVYDAESQRYPYSKKFATKWINV